MNNIDAIKIRRSVRTFQKKEIDSSLIQKITEYLEVREHLRGPFRQEIMIQYIPGTNDHLESGQKIGTYGFIKNAQAYIAGSCENDIQALTDMGYVMEKMILWLTAQGLGTCWLGGTFNRQIFARLVDNTKGRIIPAVSPLGYIEEKQRFFERTTRRAINADNKKSWKDLFFVNEFDSPLDEDSAGMWAIPLEMLRLGPSASNKQAWRVILQDNRLHLYLNESPGYNHALGYEIKRLDMGIAMCHLELSAMEMGMKTKWIFSEPKIVKHRPELKYIATLSI